MFTGMYKNFNNNLPYITIYDVLKQNIPKEEENYNYNKLSYDDLNSMISETEKEIINIKVKIDECVPHKEAKLKKSWNNNLLIQKNKINLLLQHQKTLKEKGSFNLPFDVLVNIIEHINKINPKKVNNTSLPNVPLIDKDLWDNSKNTNDDGNIISIDGSVYKNDYNLFLHEFRLLIEDIIRKDGRNSSNTENFTEALGAYLINKLFNYKVLGHPKKIKRPEHLSKGDMVIILPNKENLITEVKASQIFPTLSRISPQGVPGCIMHLDFYQHNPLQNKFIIRCYLYDPLNLDESGETVSDLIKNTKVGQRPPIPFDKYEQNKKPNFYYDILTDSFCDENGEEYVYNINPMEIFFKKIYNQQ